MTRRERVWQTAASLPALREGQAQTITLRVARRDGATEAVDRRVVFLVQIGRSRARPRLDVHAPRMPDARQRRDTRLIECPCHGGVYDLEGRVVAGPPPRALDELPTRLDGAQVLVQV